MSASMGASDDEGAFSFAVSMSMGHSDSSTRGKNYRKPTKKALCNIADNLADYIASETG